MYLCLCCCVRFLYTFNLFLIISVCVLFACGLLFWSVLCSVCFVWMIACRWDCLYVCVCGWVCLRICVCVKVYLLFMRGVSCLGGLDVWCVVCVLCLWFFGVCVVCVYWLWCVFVCLWVVVCDFYIYVCGVYFLFAWLVWWLVCVCFVIV